MKPIIACFALSWLATVSPAAEPDTSPLVHERILPAPPAEVWKVWSTAEGFKALGVARVDMDFRVGGLIRSHYKPDGELGDPGTIENRIIAYEPERMIAFRIDKPPAGFPFKTAWKSTWSVVTLTDLGNDRTHVRLAGMGYTSDEESQAMREFFRTGNAWSLQKLEAHFDTGKERRPPGKAHADAPLAPIEATAVIPAAREDIWDALTTSKGWKEFLKVDSRIALRPGGPFEIYMNPAGPEGSRGSETCTVLSFDPGHMLSFSWNAPPSLENARRLHTWVVVILEPLAAKSTRVHIKHLGFADRAAEEPQHSGELEKARSHFAGGWPRVLAALRARFDDAGARGEK